MSPLIVSIAALALALLSLALCVWRLIRSRSFQIFGELFDRIDINEKFIALTFDDGPEPEYTEMILKHLDQAGVKATFYLVGQSIVANPVQARAIVAHGHEIGNHTFTHRKMVGVSLSCAERELAMTDEAIARAGYLGPITFRPPYGKKFLLLPYCLKRRGMKTIMWDVEPDTDYKAVSQPSALISAVMRAVRPGSIILLHVMFRSRTVSLAAVPYLIEALRGKGYEFVTVSELLAKSQSRARRPASARRDQQGRAEEVLQ